jgi:cysteinyl-tRNA synthetase
VSLRLHDTATREQREFVPVRPGTASIYVCGATVQGAPHIGHVRSGLNYDVLRRWLTHGGLDVLLVRNVTDIEDKVLAKSAAAHRPWWEWAATYERAFQAAYAALGCLPPSIEPRASGHVPQMIELMHRLIDSEHAYAADGDVYFAVRSFPEYGALSGQKIDDVVQGEPDSEAKRDQRDFALWKAAKPGEPAWDSPWGPGRPGWHIECSAMAIRYLGESFDVHGGGEDLIFPHHECEIAQSEAVTGRTFARYWLHNGMVNMGREKMSKSLGNTSTIRDLVTRHDPAALRLFLLGTHYRSPLEWSEDRVVDSARALERLWRPIDDALKLATSSAPPALPPALAGFRDRFVEAMDDDFNTPEALAALFDLSRALRAEGLSADVLASGARELRELAGVLGLEGPRRAELDEQRLTRLIEERAEARRQRDWKRADEIRAEIEGLGAILEDKATGTEWRWKTR